MTDDLDPRLPHGAFGGRPELHATIGSTNDRALDLAASGAPHGTLVLADEQTSGRGRRGNPWHSPPGFAIHGSLVVRAESGLDDPAWIVAAAGLGVAEGIESAAGVAAGIKWPNDVWIDGRKVAGILVEARGYRPSSPAVVVGFGVNVGHREDDFPPSLRTVATSVRIATGREIRREAVLRAILAALEPRLKQALGEEPRAGLSRDFRARSVLLGRRVSLLDGEVPRTGIVADLSAADGLLLRTDDGALLHVRSAHASEVRPI